LVAHNCDLSQGFLHTPALSAPECERWMRQRISRPLTPIPGGGDPPQRGTGEPPERSALLPRPSRSHRRRVAAGAGA